MMEYLDLDIRQNNRPCYKSIQIDSEVSLYAMLFYLFIFYENSITVYIHTLYL